MSLVFATGCASTKTDTPETRNQQASLELARQMVGQGEYQRAVQFLLQRSKAEDAPTEVHMLLGLALLGLNNPEGALRSFSNALRLEPANDDARLNLAYTQILLGRQKDARLALGEIIKRGKYQFMERVHLNIGLTYFEEKRCDRAIPEFRAALEIDPTYSAPYFNIGKCQMSTGRLQEARASFQRAVDFCPGCIEPQLELATVTHRLGDKKQALNQLDTILRAKPDAAIEKKALALRRQLSR
ncbi:MAG: hypothetical protein RI953_139 [Pseudomonadota bacterium]|jgi:tetratricopeptide (TPR) repeat protein